MKNSLIKAIENQIDSLKKLDENMQHEEYAIIADETMGMQHVLLCREGLIAEMRNHREIMEKEMERYNADLEIQRDMELKSLFYQLDFLTDRLNQQNNKNQFLLKMRAGL